MEMEKKIIILKKINKDLDAIIFKDNDDEINKTIIYSNKLSSNILDLVVFGFEDTYLDDDKDKNYNVEMNKKMNKKDWNNFKENIESEYINLDDDSIRLIKYRLGDSDKRKSSCLEILILVKLLVEYGSIKNRIKSYFKDTTKNTYKLYNNMERVNKDSEELTREPKDTLIDKIYEDNLNWNGSNWERRTNMNLNKLSLALVATFMINKNANRNKKSIAEDLSAKIKSFNKNNTKVVMKSENTHFAYSSMLKAFSKTTKESRFKWNKQDNACPICKSYSSKIYTYKELIQLPIHPNGRCFYTVIL